MSKLLEVIKTHQMESQLLEGNFGLERENIRVNKHGEIALTPHPQAFAERSNHPFITTDFAECQIELITPVCKTTHNALSFIETLQDIVLLELQDEYLWPYSQPPILPKDDSIIQEAQFKAAGATEYRTYLSQKYGKHLQLLTGVHFNFSLTEHFLKNLHQKTQSTKSFECFKNDVYLKMARYFVKHCWFIIYMTGFGELCHQSFKLEPKSTILFKANQDYQINEIGCALRSGRHGYQNLKAFNVSYNNLNEHLDNLQKAINDGHIIEAREFYSTIRLRGRDKQFSLESLAQGIEYLEVRCIDLNPFEENGISLTSLNLIHLFLIYGLLQEEPELIEEDYVLAQHNTFDCSHFGNSPDTMLHKSNTQKINIHQWADEIIMDMKKVFKELNISSDILSCLNPPPPDRTKLIANIQQQGYVDYFLTKAKHTKTQSQSRTFQLRHYEDLELSTQVLLREAIKQGIYFEFLDRKDNFIEFHKNNIRQMVKQATKTSLDNYSTVLAMENKIVTKKCLERHNISIAKGKDYCDKQKAYNDFKHFKGQHIVIKPNSTNFGEGITILAADASQASYLKAIDFAFSYDTEILIEHFFPGKEYRFLVMGDETVAVLHREAANVVGDGISTIEQLVTQKNTNPMRGEGYRKPLEQIKLGDIEQQFLSQQHLDIYSIPQKNQKVYLRENSNISTGGDSIDFTDTMHEAYKALAIQAAKSVGAIICGVDMMITDLNQSIPEGNYCIIELNFNPAIHMHTFPSEGKDRKVALKLLKLLKLLEST